MTGILDRWRTHLDQFRVFQSARSRRRFLVHLLVAAVLFVALLLVVRRYLSVLTSGAELRAFVRGFGVFAPLVLVGLQTAQVVIAPIPGQVLAVVAGYLFGPWWGTLYNMVGITLGSTIAFWLSRRYGRAYVERIVHEDALAWFDGLDDDHTRVALFLFFLVPGLPDDVLCFAGGLTKLPLWQLVVLAVVGRTPAFFLVNLVGNYLGTDRPEAAVVLGGALLAVTALAYLSRDRLLALFDIS
jgi:uncharacterized membrane protein YdjX (TVP38/TMEM64 family)